MTELPNFYHFVGFNAEGNLFGADSGVYLINPKTGAGRRQAKIPAPGGYTPVALSHDRTLLVSAPLRRGGKMTSTDTSIWKTRFISMGKQSDLSALVISPDNRLVAFGFVNGKVLVWNLATGKNVKDFVTRRKGLSSWRFPATVKSSQVVIFTGSSSPSSRLRRLSY